MLNGANAANTANRRALGTEQDFGHHEPWAVAACNRLASGEGAGGMQICHPVYDFELPVLAPGVKLAPSAFTDTVMFDRRK